MWIVIILSRLIFFVKMNEILQKFPRFGVQDSQNPSEFADNMIFKSKFNCLWLSKTKRDPKGDLQDGVKRENSRFSWKQFCHPSM